MNTLIFTRRRDARGMLIHVPRVLWSVGRGLLKPQPLSALAGRPHIYTARVNALLDVDQFAHMNNAACAPLRQRQSALRLCHAASGSTSVCRPC